MKCTSSKITFFSSLKGERKTESAHCIHVQKHTVQSAHSLETNEKGKKISFRGVCGVHGQDVLEGLTWFWAVQIYEREKEGVSTLVLLRVRVRDQPMVMVHGDCALCLLSTCPCTELT